MSYSAPSGLLMRDACSDLTEHVNGKCDAHNDERDLHRPKQHTASAVVDFLESEDQSHLRSEGGKEDAYRSNDRDIGESQVDRSVFPGVLHGLIESDQGVRVKSNRRASFLCQRRIAKKARLEFAVRVLQLHFDTHHASPGIHFR